jgi:hypothetical protein
METYRLLTTFSAIIILFLIPLGMDYFYHYMLTILQEIRLMCNACDDEVRFPHQGGKGWYASRLKRGETN